MNQDPIESGTQFHQHLDECEQCRNHPFSLCKEGQELLESCKPKHLEEQGK